VAKALKTRQEVDELLIGPVFDDLDELEGYRATLRESGLFEQIWTAHEWFHKNVTDRTPRGYRPVLGGIPRGADARLYAVLRKLQPRAAVETGVCSGHSTSFILQSLHDNDAGKLTSIDWPEYMNTEPEEDQFWEGKGGAVVPAGKESGWAIPDLLRDRWDLVIGKSQQELPPLLDRLGGIDFFLHDGEHSYDCMTFEYEHAFEALREGGVLASDALNWNSSFDDFAARVSRPIHRLGGYVGVIFK
jgi:hypothetical protein